MNIPRTLTAVCLPLLLNACSINASPPDPDAYSPLPMVTKISTASDAAPYTVLLVSLEDGSVIKQIVNLDADICFKQSSSTATTCLTEGMPIIDPQTNSVLGFEMVEKHIDLVGRSD